MQQFTIQKKAYGINVAMQAIQSGVNELLIEGLTQDDFLKLAEALKTNTSITSLYLWCNQMGDIGAKDLAEALKTNTSLTSLDLRGNGIGDIGAKDLAEALKSNTSLTSLDLRDNRIGAAAGVNALIQNELDTNISIPKSTAKKTAFTFLCIIGRLTNKLPSDVLTYMLQVFANLRPINKGPYRQFSPLTQVMRLKPR